MKNIAIVGSIKSRRRGFVRNDFDEKDLACCGRVLPDLLVSIPTLFLYNSVRGANYILGAGPDTRVYIGGTLELIVALAGIGTAVALYPVVKRQNEGMALGFVGVRTLEAAMIFVGVFTPPVGGGPAAGRRRNERAGHQPCADQHA